MRITLNRQNLLGFGGGSSNLDVPAIAAKVGNKPATIGVRVASASGSSSADAPVAVGRVHLIYPAATVR